MPSHPVLLSSISDERGLLAFKSQSGVHPHRLDASQCRILILNLNKVSIQRQQA